MRNPLIPCDHLFQELFLWLKEMFSDTCLPKDNVHRWIQLKEWENDLLVREGFRANRPITHIRHIKDTRKQYGAPS